MSDDSISLVVREFSSSKPRFAPNEDPRVFHGTKKAFEELAAGGPLEFPTREWTREKTVEWWNAIGPAFAGVNAAWAGETPAAVESVVSKTDLDHEGIPVRILKKKDTDSDLPVVVYLHGGGFSAWSFKDGAYDGYLTRLAALGQCIVVAVDFRLAPEAPYPAGLDDAYAVTKWVVGGGLESNGVKAGKVLIAGDSSGANMSFGVALKAKQQGEDLAAGLYLLCPYSAVVETDEKYPSMAEFDGYYISEGFLIAVCNVVCTESEKEEWMKNPLLSSLSATKEELAGMPPTSVVVGELDAIRDMGIELYLKLKEAGVESLLSIMGGAVHEQQLFASHSPQVTNQSIHDLAGYAQYVAGREA